jgi:arginine transport system substrate-binding protein
MNFIFTKKLSLWIFVLLAVTFFGLFAWRFTKYSQPTTDNNTINVGLCSGYPPYELLNQQGELEGFDVDIAHAIGAQLNKKVVIKDMAFDALIMELQQGKLDLIISGMSITQQRLEKLYMVHYQGKPLTQLSLIFWKDIPDGITSLDDIKKYPDAVVCVQAGTIQEEVIKLYPTINIKYLDVPQMTMDLMYGKSLTALLENPVADGIKEKQPDIKIVRVQLPTHMHFLGNGIAIDKKQPDFAEQIKQIIAELKADGTITKLENKWFKESIHDTK